MATNIEMNVKQESDYEVIYPQTICDMVINLLNPDTKQLMGLEPTADADDAFRKVYLAQVLDGRALINFTVIGDDGTPCTGVQIESSQFCDANGNKTTPVETDDEGKISVFVDNISVQASISNYANLSDWSETIEVEFGQQYDKEITLNRYNFRSYTSSGNLIFSPEIIRVDVSLGGGGGGAGDVDYGSERIRSGGGGGGGYSVIQEQVEFQVKQNYSYTVGAGGAINKSGGKSSFLSLSAEGGKAGQRFGWVSAQTGKGNGNGGELVELYLGNSQGIESVNGLPGSAGSSYIYTSFTEQSLYGGGGGSGGVSREDTYTTYGGTGGSPGGGGGGRAVAESQEQIHGVAGINGLGGGGGGGGYYRRYGSSSSSNATDSKKGGSGVLAIRMYRQQDLS